VGCERKVEADDGRACSAQGGVQEFDAARAGAGVGSGEGRFVQFLVERRRRCWRRTGLIGMLARHGSGRRAKLARILDAYPLPDTMEQAGDLKIYIYDQYIMSRSTNNLLRGEKMSQYENQTRIG
jgi:hypothetical protein